MPAWPLGYTTPPTEPSLGGRSQQSSPCSAAQSEQTPLLEKRLFGTPATRFERLLLITQTLACLLLPIFIFIGTGMALTFQSMVILAIAAPPSAMAVLAYAMRNAWRGDKPTRDMWWHGFLLATIFSAWVMGIILGWTNRSTAGTYFDYINMGTYMEVDPTVASGRLLQDAGRILFDPGAHVDLRRAVGFKSNSLYCVAPVVMPNSSGAPAYDFWVVGVDCCKGGSGTSVQFHCGDIFNPRAAAALRVLSNGDTRAYWRLAVQEAEAAFNIRAEHPLFLHWMQDPVHEVNVSWQSAKYALLVQCMTVAVVQFLLVLAAVVALGKRPGSL